MVLDLHTLLVTAVGASAVAGLLLLLSWSQSRKVAALAMWGAAFLIGSIGVALISARGDIPDIWSITIANAIISASHGIMWAGARNFNNRPAFVTLIFAGAVIWLLACQVETFFIMPRARVALMSAIIVTYCVLSAWEFWRRRDEGLLSRWPIVILLLAHAAIIVIRVPLAGSLPLSIAYEDLRIGWWSFIIFEGVFFSFCGAYLLGGMARERITLRYKHASLIDPLTGANNRRAFLNRGEKLLHRALLDRAPAALLVFDLDNFKSINDTFGHHIGDRVLVAFCSVAMAALRPDDLFGRLGGEEFVTLLHHTPLDEGLAVAERIRANFESTVLVLDADTVPATVSVGVAATIDRDQRLADLIVQADRALYRAKEKGRNCVEYARGGFPIEVEVNPARFY